MTHQQTIEASHHANGHHKHSKLGHLIHHAAVATVLALLVVVLETHGWLGWLDTASLRVALAWKNSSSQLLSEGTRYADASVPGSIKPVLIDDEAFELAFFQESPLSRQVLTEMLERVIARQPSVVAIDIDLSPGPLGARSNQGQDELNAMLARVAAAGSPTLVLVTPFAVSDDAVLEMKYQWMRKLCEAGVHFAYPHIPISQGLALRVAPQVQSLGQVTSAAGKAGQKPFSDEPCMLVRQGPEKAFFLSTLSEGASQAQAVELASMIPLNPDAITQMVQSAVVWNGRRDDLLVGVSKGDTVLIGSSFDPRDSLITLNGQQPGVIYHAASAQTLASPATKVGHAGAFAFDLVLGVLAGYLFGWGWRQYNLAGAALDNGLGRPWRLYLAARVWLLVNFVLLGVWLLLIFSLSATLLKAQIWASPGAMILGVFVKTILASRSLEVDLPVRGPEEAQSATKAGRLALIADLCLASPLLLYGAYLTFIPH